MIINIRGTSGSGKSYLVREVIKAYTTRLPFFIKERKRPVGYLFKRGDNAKGQDLWVPGHYETPCGGCDTIPTLDMVFDLVERGHNHGHDVLFEGLLINSDRNRTIEMASRLPLRVITLATDLETCVASVQARRDNRARKRKGGPKEAKPLNPRNTEAKYNLALKNHQRFLEAGMTSYHVGREEALELVRSYLRI